jgi:epoxyqueuosine reductase
MSITAKVKEKALELGFDLVGVTSASPLTETELRLFEQWLRSGFAGTMDYMHRNLDKRLDARLLLDGAKSVVVVGLNYKPADDKDPAVSNQPSGSVAGYARYEDYHNFFRPLLHRLAEFISSQAGREVHCKVCVDSVPLAERALAARAGLGFIGRNHMLINPALGPEILLGELITDIDLQTDVPREGICAGCDKCIKACPTGALRTDGRFDARRCISYLTIEYTGDLEADLVQKVGDRLFGCDECVLACPYHHRAPICRNTSFRYYEQRQNLPLAVVLDMDQDEFTAQLGDSPLTRAGLDRLKRNARSCLENLRPT